MKLSAEWIRLITTVTISVVSLIVTVILCTIILFIFFSAEVKAKINFIHITLAFFALLAAYICINFALLRLHQNIKILIIILIPLCMAFSIASAAYILDENIFHIIERIVFSSNQKKLDNINSLHISGIKEAHDDRKFDHPKPANSRDRDALTQKSPDRNMDEKTVSPSKPAEEKDIPPIARDDGFSVSKNNPKKLNILANDIGDKLTPSIMKGPYHGSLQYNGNGSYTYTPPIDYTGNDGFSYMIEDSKGRRANADVLLSIDDSSVKLRPDSFSIGENQPLIIRYDDLTRNDGNPENYQLTLYIRPLMPPKHGTLTDDPVNKRVYYLPDPHFDGQDSFQYTVVTPDGRVSSSVVTINVGR